mmetsp:Transcript_31437/g.91184  ORF Transcript_31437/g.91184 Transcript_31437/m.91184 type:complete len:118 (+) Transcript_31437:45-398(+)
MAGHGSSCHALYDSMHHAHPARVSANQHQHQGLKERTGICVLCRLAVCKACVGTTNGGMASRKAHCRTRSQTDRPQMPPPLFCPPPVCVVYVMSGALGETLCAGGGVALSLVPLSFL